MIPDPPQASVTVEKTRDGMRLRAVDAKGHPARLPLELDAAAGMLLADRIHVLCERPAWAARTTDG